MANYFVPLAQQTPGQGINLEPVNAALDSIMQQNNQNRQFGLQQRASDRADQQFAFEQGQAKQAADRQNVELFGKRATAIDQAFPVGDPRRAQAYQNLISTHQKMFPGQALTEEELDPANGPKLMAAQAGMYLDPRDSQAKDLQLQNLQSQIAARNRPDFTTVGRDAYGQPVYGFVDPRSMKVTPVAGSEPSNGGLQPPPGQTLSGEDYLKTLPKPQADQVKALAEGRMQIPGGFALKTPYWQQMMTHVSQYDPNFDTVNYNARAATRKDFTSGKSAQNITSFNTAIGHLDELDHAIEGLENSDYMPVNAATNATAGVNADRAKRLAAFGTARNAVVEELTRAFKGTGGSLTEVEGWEKLLDPNSSPAALKQAVKTAVNLLASRIDSVGEQYNKGMGTTSDPVKLLTPKAQKLWLKLNGGEQAPASDAAPSGTPLASPKTKADYDALPSGTRYTDPNGTPRVKP